MTRRTFGLLITLNLSFLVAPLAPRRSRRRKCIGSVGSVLALLSLSPPWELEVFRQGLRDGRLCRGPEPRY